MRKIVLACSLLVPGVAAAQEAPSGHSAFAGPYAGVEAGVHDHGFSLEYRSADGTADKRSYDKPGFGVGTFAGYDLAVSRRVRLGGELTGNIGGGKGGRADLPGGGVFALRPRWGVNAVARVGYVVGRGVLLYGTIGYGGYRYRLRSDQYVANAKKWDDGVAFGGGVEARLSPRVGTRLDVRILDGQATQVLVGVPIRF